MGSTEKSKRVEPIRITDPEAGKTYMLEFSRRSIERMERQGFVASSVADYPITAIPALFHGAFYKNHAGITREQTDKILYEIGDVPGLLGRLSELYNEPIQALLGTNDEGESQRKNSKFTVEM